MKRKLTPETRRSLALIRAEYTARLVIDILSWGLAMLISYRYEANLAGQIFKCCLIVSTMLHLFKIAHSYLYAMSDSYCRLSEYVMYPVNAFKTTRLCKKYRSESYILNLVTFYYSVGDTRNCRRPILNRLIKRAERELAKLRAETAVDAAVSKDND